MLHSDFFSSRGETSTKQRKMRALGFIRGPQKCPECGVHAERKSLDLHIAAKHQAEIGRES